MEFDNLLKFLENEKWNQWNDALGCSVPTDVCPAYVIKEFNDNSFRIGGGYITGFVPPERDPYITTKMFEEMRKRIGYTDEQIRNEARLIYSRKEYDAFYKG